MSVSDSRRPSPISRALAERIDHGNRLTFELLPEQPDAEYGTDLPFHLMYPFVSGKYCFKCASTQRITIDFGRLLLKRWLPKGGFRRWRSFLPNGTVRPGPGLFPVAGGERMAIWNDFVSKSYDDHIERKRKAREFGYFNYGDWLERGRNQQ